MPQIEIGEAQAEYLEALRSTLAERYLEEGYGVMRTRDAVQYLIDEHGPAEAAVRPDDATGDADASPSAPDDPGAASDDADADADTDAGGDGDDAESGDDADGTDADAVGGSSNPLQRTMQLLDENDEVWEAVDSNDGKYAVTLPDGSTEYARTRDDVRALLFKHYR